MARYKLFVFSLSLCPISNLKSRLFSVLYVVARPGTCHRKLDSVFELLHVAATTCTCIRLEKSLSRHGSKEN